MTFASLMSLARDTVSDPRGSARRVLAWDVPTSDRWLALALTVLISTLMTHLSFELSREGAPPYLVEWMSVPVRTALLQWVALFFGTMAVYRIGRSRGGTGSLPDAISLMAWLQFVLLVVQGAQLVAQVIVPPLAPWIGLAGVGLFFWLLTHFVAELHGFRSLGATFAGIIAATVALAFGLALVLAPFVPQVQTGG